MLCKFSYPTELFNIIQIELENRDFHKSLYFYIVDAEKRAASGLVKSILTSGFPNPGISQLFSGIPGFLLVWIPESRD